MKKRYLYFLPAGIAVVLLTGLFYNRPAADTATPAAAGTEGQGLSELYRGLFEKNKRM